MKKITLLIGVLLIGLTTIVVKAQGSWTLQTNPLGSGDAAMIGKVQFTTPVEGWICTAKNGSILHTTNTGLNWTVLTPYPQDVVWTLSDPDINMCFINPATGWLIKTFGNSEEDSNGAVVYKTTDNGTTWQRIVLSQNTDDLGLQIQFVDANNGWASIYNFSSGNFTVLKSTDGGNTWNPITTPTPTFSGYIFHFVDTNNGWAITVAPGLAPPYAIIHTTDGGENWTQQYSDDTAGELNLIRFTDLNNGWVVGLNNKIFKTADGGITWQKINNTGLTADYNPKCVFFIDANTGWIGSKQENSLENAIVLHTTNAGDSWIIQNTPVQEAVFSIFFWDENNGWLTADYGQIAHYSENFGTNENLLNQMASIYPNPNNGEFYVYSQNETIKLDIEIYNSFGQKIYKASTLQPHSKNKIDFRTYSKGIYFIKIKDGESILTKKIVIQ